ncbi:XrtA system polysaccharide chain length determinant [Yunchengibacter salinarum]|uniref:XrtA system polysaccharide chain length determinant n=1 Tax=Yunchengibacter salinarum TaxID=3133399 RepID=UPI0035B652F0
MANTLGLHELYQQVMSIAYGIWRKRWYLLTTAWFISLVGWGTVSTMPYRYEAGAQVFVDTQTILPRIAQNMGINIDVMRQVDVVRRTLVTRPNLEKIIRRSDYLDRFAQTGKEMDEMVRMLQRNIQVISLEGGMFRIKFEIADGRLSDRQRAEVAKSVVNNLLSFFMERNSRGGESKSAGAVDFLSSQIREYTEKLEESERIHAEFKQENMQYLGGQESFLSRLETARRNLSETRSELSELQVTVDTLKEQLKNVPPTVRQARSSQSGGADDRDPLEERISELKKKYDTLKSRGMKEKHPDVQNVQRQIVQLEEELAAKREEARAQLEGSADAGAASTSGTESPNRLYEQLMLELINNRTQLAKLEKREEEQILVVQEMEAKAKKVPEIEAEEKRLRRDYATIRRQYTELLQEQQDLELKQKVEGADESVSMRVVEPPVTPQLPSGPPRLLYLTFVLVGALASGLGVALIASQIRPVVVTVDQLRASFDMPVLGNVTRVLSDEESRQKSMELLVFGLIAGGLFLAYVGFVALDIFGAPTIGGR